jgi:DNA-binding IscR family transcriptional regulator
MVEDLIPEDVRQFILKSIDSIAQLEALLLLYRSPEEEWSISAVAQRLYIPEQEASPLLARLQAEGLIVARAGESLLFQYQPDSIELAELVKRVAEIYSKHLVPVTNLIHSKPRTRIQEFADAFKLRKDD